MQQVYLWELNASIATHVPGSPALPTTQESVNLDFTGPATGHAEHGTCWGGINDSRPAPPRYRNATGTSAQATGHVHGAKNVIYVGIFLFNRSSPANQ